MLTYRISLTKQRQSLSKSTGRPRVLITGIEGFDDQKEAQLAQLGMLFVEKAADCTHLVASRIQRTVKMLCAIPFAPIFVHKSWLDDCVKHNKIMGGYIFNIPNGNISNYRTSMLPN